MKLKQYMQDCQRTLSDLGSLKLNLSHMAMGMSSEINELSTAIRQNDKVNIGEELADICWYAGNLSTMIGIGDINDEITFKEDDNRTLEDFISLCNNTIKRYVAYDKTIDGGEEIWLQMYIDAIFKNIEILCLLYDLNFEQILENNIDKLKIRFPDKFTTTDALNRDLIAEYKELEK